MSGEKFFSRAIILGGNCPGRNNPEGNHPGGNCPEGNYPESNFPRGQLSGHPEAVIISEQISRFGVSILYDFEKRRSKLDLLERP